MEDRLCQAVVRVIVCLHLGGRHSVLHLITDVQVKPWLHLKTKHRMTY